MSALLSRLEGADKTLCPHTCCSAFFKCVNPVSVQTQVHLIHGIILDGVQSLPDTRGCCEVFGAVYPLAVGRERWLTSPQWSAHMPVGSPACKIAGQCGRCFHSVWSSSATDRWPCYTLKRTLRKKRSVSSEGELTVLTGLMLVFYRSNLDFFYRNVGLSLNLPTIPLT